jgi:hypothetical protein
VLKIVRRYESWISGLAPLPRSDEFHKNLAHRVGIERDGLPYLKQLNTPASSGGWAGCRP